jgi:hypothetical protein
LSRIRQLPHHRVHTRDAATARRRVDLPSMQNREELNPLRAESRELRRSDQILKTASAYSQPASARRGVVRRVERMAPEAKRRAFHKFPRCLRRNEVNLPVVTSPTTAVSSQIHFRDTPHRANKLRRTLVEPSRTGCRHD